MKMLFLGLVEDVVAFSLSRAVLGVSSSVL